MRNPQPTSDWCFICGRLNPKGLKLKFYDNGENEVYTETTLTDEYQGYPGIAHGGIVAAILDETVGRVAMIGNHHHFMFSVTLQVKYRHPVPLHTPLRFIGRIAHLRGRLGRAVGECFLPDGTLAAESHMTLADIPKELMDQINMEALGWRIE